MTTHDGYVITPRAEDAMACFDLEGVRHVAELASGEGFVAFEGPVPCAGTVFENMADDGWWWGVVRHIAPSGGHDPETFGLYSAEAFRAMSPLSVQMATPVGMDLVLAMTYGPQPNVLWQSDALRYLDKRVALDPALA